MAFLIEFQMQNKVSTPIITWKKDLPTLKGTTWWEEDILMYTLNGNTVLIIRVNFEQNLGCKTGGGNVDVNATVFTHWTTAAVVYSINYLFEAVAVHFFHEHQK